MVGSGPIPEVLSSTPSFLDDERQPFSFEAATHPAKRRVYATNGGRRALKRVGDNKTTP